MELQNLGAALAGKRLVDLEPTVPVGKSNLIEPTKAEIESMIAAFKQGRDIKWIRKNVRRAVNDGSYGFSKEQILAVHRGWRAAIQELRENA